MRSKGCSNRQEVLTGQGGRGGKDDAGCQDQEKLRGGQ